MRILLKEDYLTKVGLVSLKIETEPECMCSIKQQNGLTSLLTANNSIEIFAFEDIKEWLQGTDNAIQYSKGWMIKILKISDNAEQLKFSCELENLNPSIEVSTNSGEHLDALWIDNQTDILSIGTEDNEMLRYRAFKNDYMPQRLNRQIPDFLFTFYTHKGFCTEIPELIKGEQIYFHYLIAGSPKMKNINYPNEDHIATWFAVDYSKQVLVDRLNLLDWK